MLNMERIPDQTGYLVMTEEGAVMASGGELENEERVASIITNLITLTKNVDPVAFPTDEGFKKLTITYDDHCFIVCLSNKKIHVVKKRIIPDSIPTEPITNA